METKIIKLNIHKPDPQKIDFAAKILRSGGLVAFPTETVYGLGANALDAQAVRKIFKAKKRPLDNPMIVHIAEVEEVKKLTLEVPEKASKLMKKFWPGPLTLVLRKSKIVPDEVTANLPTVAIRMPSHPVARALLKRANIPIAAPSANLAGKPSTTSQEHVIDDLKGKVDLILASGKTDIGLESTVIDLTSKTPILLRPGGVTLEELKEILGKVKVHPIVKAEKKFGGEVKSPGMKYRHYAPNARVIVVEGEGKKVQKKIQELANHYKKMGEKVGILTTNKKNNYSANITTFLGNTPEKIAHNLFEILREMDKQKVDTIIAEGVETKKLGLAIMNRLKKAASEVIKA